jgi:tetratricopeptide (TPR) repeat protein
MRRAERPTRTGRPAQLTRLGAAVLAVAVLAGCASRGRPSAAEPPTLAELERRPSPVLEQRPLSADVAQAQAAYRAYLAAVPQPQHRAQALRRLGDLALDRAEEQAEPAAATADIRSAVAQYESVLKAHPDDPGNDRVLYQLARAHDLLGSPSEALRTLDRLVARHPGTPWRAEAQFRRGELLFTQAAFAPAEAAFAEVTREATPTPFHERALYMRGWSQFRQAKLEPALQSFLAVLDGRLAALPAGAGTETLPRADRELVEDTLRVTSLSLQQLDGAASIPPLLDRPARQAYAHRLYEHLGQLYLAQERVKDAAETFAAFGRLQPDSAPAAVLQARVVSLYADHGFAQQALQAKRAFVEQHGPDSRFRQLHPQAYAAAEPLVRQHLAELARHHHARFQQQQQAADADEALRRYRSYLAAFPGADDVPKQTFLMAELLAETRRWPEAAEAYERAAYTVASHPQAADAGYAAVLAHAERVKAAASDAARTDAQRVTAQAARRFAAAYPTDPRAAPALADAADRLMAAGDMAAAAQVAGQVEALGAAAPSAARRTALAVRSQHALEQQQWLQAEQATAQLLALQREAGAAGSDETARRLATALYRQAEQAWQSRQASAAELFRRAIEAAPASDIAAAARFDLATVQMAGRDWAAAVATLQGLRAAHPAHPLTARAAPRLAAAHLELGQPGPAAEELLRVAAAAEPEAARAALWQAAELLLQDRQPARAATLFERYVRQHPQPPEPALQARLQLARLAQERGQGAQALGWARELQQAAAAPDVASLPRTPALVAQASLILAGPALEAYRQVRLVEPLARQLALKKSRFEAVVQAYAAAAQGGGPEVVTEATFRTAAVYEDFGKALLAAPRPRGLRKAEAEQYQVMVEEQAFPFEEKAAELHEANARRTAEGRWDPHVRDSLAALARLKPARWNRSERTAAEPPAGDLAAAEAALTRQAADAPRWNALGVAYRRAGRWADAQRAYERAAQLQPGDATPLLNLAILDDLYRRDRSRALETYRAYQARLGSPDPQVARWIDELNQRKPDAALAAAGDRR